MPFRFFRHNVLSIWLHLYGVFVLFSLCCRNIVALMSDLVVGMKVDSLLLVESKHASSIWVEVGSSTFRYIFQGGCTWPCPLQDQSTMKINFNIRTH